MKILLVEDDPQLAALLSRGLTEEGHQVDRCARAGEAEHQGRTIRYDVIVLDWGLPDRDGISLLRSWRERGMQTPVLMLTARSAVGERVAGLRAGADDFVAKPFEFAEPLARLDALHRRAGGAGVASFGSVALDTATRELVSDAGRVALTQREWQLARVLFDKKGDVLTRSELLSLVWGPDFAGEPNVVDVYVGYLRNKLDQLNGDVVIRTVRSMGYRLEQRKP